MPVPSLLNHVFLEKNHKRRPTSHAPPGGQKLQIRLQREREREISENQNALESLDYAIQKIHWLKVYLLNLYDSNIDWKN